MSELLERLREDFKSEDARYEYADSLVNAFISGQIKALREERTFSQERLAELIGTKQSGISRLEKADYSAWKIETLRRLAKAFRVRLKISFEEFGTLLTDLSGFTAERLTPRKFEDDPVFREGSEKLKRRRKVQPITGKRRAHTGRRKTAPRKPPGCERYAESPLKYGMAPSAELVAFGSHPFRESNSINTNQSVGQLGVSHDN